MHKGLVPRPYLWEKNSNYLRPEHIFNMSSAVAFEDQETINQYNKGVKKAYRISGQSMNQKGLCHHMLRGFCRRRGQCEFSHDIHNIPTCTKREPVPGGSSCEDKDCNMRHPKLCTFFIQLRCHFGHRCLLFHPKERTALPSMVQKLQRTVKKMEEAITKLWREVEALKRPEPELMHPTTEPQPPDPEPIPTALMLAAHTEQAPPMPDPLPDLEIVVRPLLAHPGAGSERVLPIPTDMEHISPDPDTERLSSAKFEQQEATNLSGRLLSYTCKVCSNRNSKILESTCTIPEYVFGVMTVTCEGCGTSKH